MKKDEIMDLVNEAVQESYFEGSDHAFYTHTEYGHTVKYRQSMLNHKAIKEKVLGEIKHALESLPQ